MTDVAADQTVFVYHPGEILRRDVLDPLGMSANALALALRIPAPRITELVRGRRGMTPDTALRLARFLGGSAEMWMGLQSSYDLAVARESDEERIFAEVLPADLEEKSVRKLISKAAKRHAGDLKDRL